MQSAPVSSTETLIVCRAGIDHSNNDSSPNKHYNPPCNGPSRFAVALRKNLRPINLGRKEVYLVNKFFWS